MARLDELERVLGPRTVTDVPREFERFRTETGSEDADLFLRRLVEQGLLTRQNADEVQAELTAAGGGAGRTSATAPMLPDSARAGGSRPGSRPGGRRPAGGGDADACASRFVLEEVLGEGGMGIVHRARDLELGRQVAVKRLVHAHTPEICERFVREARITAGLDHPNIVPVHVLEVAPDGVPLGYAMKLVEGVTLGQLLRETAALYKGGAAIDEAHALTTRLDHFLKVCDAMAFAHSRGILHRDLKPSNVMIGRFNEVYVMDWGVARPLGDAGGELPADEVATTAGGSPSEPELTRVGDVIGTAHYMSPEQALGHNRELDARSDQYSLGLILFEVVSLRRAVSAKTSDDALTDARRAAKGQLEHLSPRERIAPELEAIVARATAPAPADRYPSVSALAEDVRRYLRGDAVLARPDRPLQRLLRLMSRHRRATLVAFLGVLALAAITVSYTLYRKKAGELAERDRGERITAFFIDVTAQAHRIDARFQRMAEALEGLRTAAIGALTGPEPVGEQPLYFDVDFADPARRPPDFTDQTTYRWPVSVEHPVIGLAPGTSRDAVLPTVRRLAPLRGHMRRMFVEAATGGLDPVPPELERAILLERQGPIDYAYVCLPSGVHFMLPGMAALPPGYDVRTAGFYTISDHRHGKRWGRPYVDSTTDEQGDDLVLPCTQGLWAPSGEFLGVAGVEITVTKIVETALALPGRATVRTSLVNGEGKKVIDSGDAGKRFQADGKDEGMTLHDFDLPDVALAIRGGQAGVRHLERDGRELLVAFVRLDAIGWYYVVEVEASSVIGR